MSLWLQSLSYCMDNSGEDTKSKAKYILSHLSMDTPRSWWEQALETNNVESSHAGILNDLKKELLEIPELDGKIDSGMLVALAFADKEEAELKFGIDDSPFSAEEYLDKAKEIFIARPKLSELGRPIDKTNHPV